MAVLDRKSGRAGGAKCAVTTPVTEQKRDLRPHDEPPSQSIAFAAEVAYERAERAASFSDEAVARRGESRDRLRVPGPGSWEASGR